MTTTRRFFLNLIFGAVTALPCLAELHLEHKHEPDELPPTQPIALTAGPLSPARKYWPRYSRLSLVTEVSARMGHGPQATSMKQLSVAENVVRWEAAHTLYDGGPQ